MISGGLPKNFSSWLNYLKNLSIIFTYPCLKPSLLEYPFMVQTVPIYVINSIT